MQDRLNDDATYSKRITGDRIVRTTVYCPGLSSYAFQRLGSVYANTTAQEKKKNCLCSNANC